RDEVIAERLHAGDVAPRPRKAVDESCTDEITPSRRDNDRNGLRLQLEQLCQPRAADEEGVDLEPYEFGSARAELVDGFAEAPLDDDVLTVYPAKLSHRHPQRVRRN